MLTRCNRGYLTKESEEKRKVPFDFEGWTDVTEHDGPYQNNGFDCGVFACQFINYLCKGGEVIAVTQDRMQHLRNRMTCELVNSELL